MLIVTVRENLRNIDMDWFQTSNLKLIFLILQLLRLLSYLYFSRLKFYVIERLYFKTGIQGYILRNLVTI